MDRTSFFVLAAGLRPVKIKHTSIESPRTRVAGMMRRLARTLVVLAVAFTAVAALAQHAQTIDQIRVIGNRRIPKETILARLFTHEGDTYDPVSIERDFNSLWNTGYFENLRIEREDSEKGIILNIFVQEKPTIREINYKGSTPSPSPIVLDRFKKEKVALLSRKPVRPDQDQARRDCHQGDARRARPPVRHHQDRSQDHSPGLRAGELQHQGRPDGQSRQDQVRRQPARQRPRAAPLDEESEAHRHSLFDHLRGPLRHRPSTPPSSRKTPSGFARPTATRATPTPPSRSPRRRFATRAA